MSGHWHPKLRMPVRGQNLSRRCFVHAPGRLILPAFGAFTGGMRADDPAITRAVGTPAEALVPANARLLRFPLGGDRKSVGKGKSVSVRVELRGSCIHNNKHKIATTT